MKAIILAAGNGSRMRPLTARPKCLLAITGESLLLRQVRLLRSFDIRDIVIVTGYEEECVRLACDSDVAFISNPAYRSTNSLYSLWLARSYVAEGCIVLNSDVLFHGMMLRNLLDAPHPAVLLMSVVDAVSEPLGAEEMKIRLDGALVRDISKEMDPAEADGENVGIARFNASQARSLVKELDRLVEVGAAEWAPRAFKAYADRFALHAISTGGYPWIEIDTPDDYLRAVRSVAPRVDY